MDSTAFDSARVLIGMEPPPVDAFPQLEALEALITAREELPRFGDLYEALYATGVLLPMEKS